MLKNSCIINNRYINILVNILVARMKNRTNSPLVTDSYLKSCFNLLCQLILYFILSYIRPFYTILKRDKVLSCNNLKSYANICSCSNMRFFLSSVYSLQGSLGPEKLFRLLLKHNLKEQSYNVIFHNRSSF